LQFTFAHFTVITPLSKIHRDALSSFAITHLSMLFPSNKTIASEGGKVPIPGVTIFGLGSHTSVASGFVKSFLNTEPSCAWEDEMTKPKQRVSIFFMMAFNFCYTKQLVHTILCAV
jgi:hypothetical protein